MDQSDRVAEKEYEFCKNRSFQLYNQLQNELMIK